MGARPHPYRTAAQPPPADRREIDPLARAQRLAEYAVLGWALVRLVACSLHGFDLEGCLALVILARRFA